MRIKEFQTRAIMRLAGLAKEPQPLEFTALLNQTREELQVDAVLELGESRNVLLSRQILCDLAASRDGCLFKKNNKRRVEVVDGAIKPIDQ